MPIIPNPTLTRLRAGKLALGFCVYHLRSSAVAMLAHATGYDWLFIDTEHGAFSVQEASQISYAGDRAGHHPDRAGLRGCAG